MCDYQGKSWRRLQCTDRHLFFLYTKVPVLVYTLLTSLKIETLFSRWKEKSWVHSEMMLTARNSDLAFAAVSALSRASARLAMSWACSSSQFLRSVMLVMEPAIRTAVPFLSQSAWPRMRKHKYVPFFICRGVSTSKGWEWIPWAERYSPKDVITASTKSDHRCAISLWEVAKLKRQGSPNHETQLLFLT